MSNFVLNYSPAFVVVGGFLLGLGGSVPILKFSIGVSSILVLNLALKCASKKLLYANTVNLPLLGRGMRPVGQEKESPMEFGMPSGHAHFAFFCLGYYLCSTGDFGFGSAALLIAATLVAASRVWQGFHTVRQVVIGGVLGCISGPFVCWLFK